MAEYVCKKIEDCFVNSRTYSYQFSFPITEELLQGKSRKGELRLKKNFRRPCYFFDLPNGIKMKGILNDTGMKVSFPNEGWENFKADFEKELEQEWMKKF